MNTIYNSTGTYDICLGSAMPHKLLFYDIQQRKLPLQYRNNHSHPHCHMHRCPLHRHHSMGQNPPRDKKSFKYKFQKTKNFLNAKGLSFLLTREWQSVKTGLVMMLHCLIAQALRCGFVSHGFIKLFISGQLGFTLQLFPNATASVTSSPSCFTKSLFALPSKFPQSPHTLPCHRDHVGVKISG